MDNRLHQRFPVVDRSYTNTVKREITKLSEGYGFGKVETGKLDVIVSELVTNLTKHTTHGGELLVKPISKGEHVGIEILSLDNGPGMREPSRMMEDGVSTAGSMGQGLGAIKRMSDEFDLYSLYGSGTVVLSRLYKATRKTCLLQQSTCHFCGLMVAKDGESLSGDAWTLIEANNYRALLVLDGLGHGHFAHEASAEAIQAFQPAVDAAPSQALRSIHAAIRKTRGAVGAIALMHPQQNSLAYCGIGNITGRLINPEKNSSLMSYNGTLGHNIPIVLNDHTFKWQPNSLLIMHSDGLTSKWDLNKYPNLTRHDGSVIAGVLYKEYNRKVDDTLVVVGKYHSLTNSDG